MISTRAEKCPSQKNIVLALSCENETLHSYFYNAFLRTLPAASSIVWNIKFIKYRQNKLIVTKCRVCSKCPPLAWTQARKIKGIGQVHHQPATAPRHTTDIVDDVAAHQCHELWSHTHVAEWQTKWHNPPDLGLMNSVATCLSLWSLEWCVIAVQFCHMHDRKARYPAKK